MSDLSFLEKMKLEKLFGMGSGYVLDFSNRTFQAFVFESTGRDIYDEKYSYATGSKANRLRAFWNEEANHVAGKLIAALVEYALQSGVGSGSDELFDDARRIAQRLAQGAPVLEIEAITPDMGAEISKSLPSRSEIRSTATSPNQVLTDYTLSSSSTRGACARSAGSARTGKNPSIAYSASMSRASGGTGSSSRR